MSSKPRDIRRSNAASSPAASSPAPSALSGRHSRHASIARLGSPVPHRSLAGESPIPQIPTPAQAAVDNADLPMLEDDSLLPRPGQSALSTALAGSSREHPSLREGNSQGDNTPTGLGNHDRLPLSNYGSFAEHREVAGSPLPVEDPEVVKRHLVQFESSSGLRNSLRMPAEENAPGLDSNEFSSLRLQGGDMTREIYRWAEDPDHSLRGRAKRSQSFNVSRPPPEDETLDRKNIMIPGGFRRNFLRRTGESPAPSAHSRTPKHNQTQAQGNGKPQRPLFTNNFLEFLTLYGHFAGEELEEDDEVLEPDEYFSSEPWDGYTQHESTEHSALLTPGTPGMRRRKPRGRPTTGTHSQTNAMLLLLKSFVGTGVLFLPKAFLNGGMLFSSITLLSVAGVSFYCFILLLDTRKMVEGSFGDMGGIIFGKWFRSLILISLVISQIGFSSAYTVFTAKNLQAFVLAVTNCKTYIDIKFMVLLQVFIFLPLSLIRDIGKLGFTALVADAFILLGLVYLFYYDILTLARQHGLADIKLFNPDSWTLLIGTAIFSFEGVGLLIPIQEAMAKPEKFPQVLSVTMIISVVVFTSMGVLSYAAYGSKTEAVVLLNLPQDSNIVNAVQLLYSVAILLSTPLQLFPAIRIIENEFFTRSGKYNPYIKWQKNIFRFFFVLLCSLIAWGGANDLDKFVSLVGSFACLPLVYVYPPLMHWKVAARHQWQRVLDWVIFGIGIVGMCYTTSLAIKSWGDEPPKQGYCDR